MTLAKEGQQPLRGDLQACFGRLVGEGTLTGSCLSFAAIE